jgi:hypothetical protein
MITLSPSVRIRLAMLALAACAATSAGAATVPIAAPPSVLPGALTNQTDAYVFLEKTLTLGSPLSVDISAPGLYNSSSPTSLGSIPAGTDVSSYMIHHESVNQQYSFIYITFTFPEQVLGIITTDAGLNATDLSLGNPGTAYPTGLANRGLEMPYTITPDSVFWAGNQVYVAVASTTALVLDQMRVITAATIPVPEPASITLSLLASAGLALVCWRKRRK